MTIIIVTITFIINYMGSKKMAGERHRARRWCFSA
jgi:hypothetical protein